VSSTRAERGLWLDPGMAWVKVPAEHHPIFMAAVPQDRRVTTMQMFGGIAAKVNGHIFGGLFGRSAIVHLSSADRAEALALDGAGPFDPMGTGRASKDMIMLPEDVMEQAEELRGWLARALTHVATLPPKAAQAAKAAKAAKAKPAAKANKPAAAAKSKPKSKPKPKKQK
jgi:hypothetical protein